MHRFFIIIVLTLLFSCKEDPIPKPKGYLSLSYADTSYEKFHINYPYSFEVSAASKIVKQPKNWLKITYPKLKASVNITYRPVENNLNELLVEAEKLVFEHTLKADQISSNNYENQKNKVFGSMFDITGNSASQVQFHVTDSVKHFLKGSLFFHTKPNYDSILPAVEYIKKDMIHMMETTTWNN